jgi:hypothetical protein
VNAPRTTQEQARYEAWQMLDSVKRSIKDFKLDIIGAQLVGTYPLQGTTGVDVVQVLYSKKTTENPPARAQYRTMFDVPPAEVLQCLNPAFELS